MSSWNYMSPKDLFKMFGNSSPQTKTEVDVLFQNLKSLSKKKCYQDALDVMQKAPEEFRNAFATIMQEFPQTQVPVGPTPVRKPVKVHLIITGQTYEAHQQFLDQLNSQGSKVTPTDDLQKCDFILLFCPVLSRVRSDVEAAFRMIPDGAQGKPVVLVLMHHTRKPDLILNQTHWREMFPCISLNLDVLYHETVHGLLHCSRNEEAVLTLQNMCDRYMKEKKSSQPLMQAKTKTEIEKD